MKKDMLVVAPKKDRDAERNEPGPHARLFVWLHRSSCLRSLLKLLPTKVRMSVRANV